MKPSSRFVVLSLVLSVACCVHALGQTTQASAPGELRVMTFNIRLQTPADGEDDWPHRREMWLRTVRAFDPDLLGLQEVTPGQGNEIKSSLNEDEMLGKGRSGNMPGEASSILFRKTRFERVRSGMFWLSATPDVPASVGWDAKFPRVVTWVELRDRNADEKHARLFYFNTHWDHKGEEARQHSAGLMRSKISEIAGEAPVIVTGDFNSGDSSKAHELFLNPQDAEAGKLHLVDSYRELHPQRKPEDFTAHGFKGVNGKGTRIDWILHTDDFRAEQCEIDHTSEKGHYPSDHFPVKAVLQPVERKASPATSGAGESHGSK